MDKKKLTLQEAIATALQAQFEEEVNRKAKEVDPSQDQDWFSLTLGWAIAKGLTPKEAHDFAIFIRYHTDLG